MKKEFLRVLTFICIISILCTQFFSAQIFAEAQLVQVLTDSYNGGVSVLGDGAYEKTSTLTDDNGIAKNRYTEIDYDLQNANGDQLLKYFGQEANGIINKDWENYRTFSFYIYVDAGENVTKMDGYLRINCSGVNKDFYSNGTALDGAKYLCYQKDTTTESLHNKQWKKISLDIGSLTPQERKDIFSIEYHTVKGWNTIPETGEANIKICISEMMLSNPITPAQVLLPVVYDSYLPGDAIAGGGTVNFSDCFAFTGNTNDAFQWSGKPGDKLNVKNWSNYGKLSFYVYMDTASTATAVQPVLRLWTGAGIVEIYANNATDGVGFKYESSDQRGIWKKVMIDLSSDALKDKDLSDVQSMQFYLPNSGWAAPADANFKLYFANFEFTAPKDMSIIPAIPVPNKKVTTTGTYAIPQAVKVLSDEVLADNACEDAPGETPQGADFTRALKLEGNVDKENASFKFLDSGFYFNKIALMQEWNSYKTLSFWIYLDPSSTNVNYVSGKIRLRYHHYYKGSQFFDFTYDTGEIGKWKKITLDLSEGASCDSGEISENMLNITHFELFTYDPWIATTSGNTGSVKLYFADFQLSNPVGKYPYDSENKKFFTPTYDKPLPYTHWIEGEDTDTDNAALVATNFIEGPTKNCWVYDYFAHSKGVNDLAASQLLPFNSSKDPAAADNGEGKAKYYARYKINVTEAGWYTSFFMGRVPGYMGSPFKWQIDEGSLNSVGEGEKYLLHYYGALESERIARNSVMKYGLLNMGDFYIDTPGEHTITIYVDTKASALPGLDVAADGTKMEGYTQQIDAISVHKYSDFTGFDPNASPINTSSYTGWTYENLRNIPTANTTTSSENNVKVSSGNLCVTINKENGGVQKIELKEGKTVKTLLDAASVSSLVKVRFVDGTDTSIIPSSVSKSEDGIITISGTTNNVTANVTLKPVRGQEQIKISASFVNNSSNNIDCVEIMQLKGIKIDTNSDDDTYYLGKKQYLFSNLSSSSFEQLTSPQFTFDFVCATDKNYSLYYYFKDQNSITTKAEIGKDQSQTDTAVIRTAKYPKIANGGGQWTSPEIIIGAYKGDWHKAGDYFSQWWYSWAETPTVPNWFKSIGAVVTGYEYYGSDASQKSLSYLDNIKTKLGITYVHTGGWLPYNTEAWYPDNYILSDSQTSTVTSLNDQIHNAGGRISFYTNGVMLSRMTDYFFNGGRNNSIMSYNGKIYLSEHNARHHAMALPCPDSDWSTDFYNAVKPIVETDNLIDTLYIDQIGAMPTHLCYDETHSHNQAGGVGYGNWVNGYGKLVKNVVDKAKAAGRTGENTLVTAIEDPSAFAQQYASYSLLNSNDVFKYVFPTYTGTRGILEDATLEAEYKYLQGAFLSNELFITGIGNVSNLLKEENAAIAVEFKKLMDFKKLISPILWDAKYRDNVGVTTSDDNSVNASIFVNRQANKIFVPIVRKQVGDKTITVDLKAQGYTNITNAKVITDSNSTEQKIKFSKNKNRVTFTVPQEQASVIVLTANAHLPCAPSIAPPIMSIPSQDMTKIDKNRIIKVDLSVKLDSATAVAKASIDDSVLTKAIEAAKPDLKGIRTIALAIPKVEGAIAYVQELNSKVLTSKDKKKVIKVTTELGTIAAQSDMLKDSNVFGNQKVELMIARADRSRIDEGLKAQIGDWPVIQLEVKSNGKAISWNNPRSPVSISVPYEPTETDLEEPEHIVVWYLDGKGKAVPVPNGRYNAATNTIDFQTTHFGFYALQII